MRLFIAINFDEPTKRALQAVQGRLRQVAPSGSYTRPENLHLTLAFLGETPAERLSAVQRAMRRVSMPPMRLVFDHTGVFRQGRQDLWWIGLQAEPALLDLRRSLARSLLREGFELPQSAFVPHLTLARRMPPGLRAGSLLPARIAAPVHCFHLMLSERVQGVLTYSQLFEQRGC